MEQLAGQKSANRIIHLYNFHLNLIRLKILPKDPNQDLVFRITARPHLSFAMEEYLLHYQAGITNLSPIYQIQCAVHPKNDSLM